MCQYFLSLTFDLCSYFYLPLFLTFVVLIEHFMIPFPWSLIISILFIFSLFYMTVLQFAMYTYIQSKYTFKQHYTPSLVVGIPYNNKMILYLIPCITVIYVVYLYALLLLVFLINCYILSQSIKIKNFLLPSVIHFVILLLCVDPSFIPT